MTDRSLSSLIGALASRPLSDWAGLPAGVTVGDAESQAATIGEGGTEAALVHLDDPAPGCSARAWARDDDKEVVLLEVAWVSSPPSWPAGLGEPDRRDDVVDGLVGIEGGEWIYATRGLAVVTSPDGGHVRHAFGFTPTTADAYAREIRVGLAVKRRPPSSHGGFER